jgi:hypothetical protein
MASVPTYIVERVYLAVGVFDQEEFAIEHFEGEIIAWVFEAGCEACDVP